MAGAASLQRDNRGPADREANNSEMGFARKVTTGQVNPDSIDWARDGVGGNNNGSGETYGNRRPSNLEKYNQGINNSLVGQDDLGHFENHRSSA
jgi:hypothetical protein